MTKLIQKLADIKDWRIALIYMIAICFISYCMFFGGGKFVNDIFFGDKSVEKTIEPNHAKQ